MLPVVRLAILAESYFLSWRKADCRSCHLSLLSRIDIAYLAVAGLLQNGSASEVNFGVAECMSEGRRPSLRPSLRPSRPPDTTLCDSQDVTSSYPLTD